MLEQIGGILVQIIVTVLIVKFYMDARTKKEITPVVSWKDASVVIEKLEQRISQLQERETASQEKVWNLEDQNKVLKMHIAELNRDRAAKALPTTT